MPTLPFSFCTPQFPGDEPQRSTRPAPCAERADGQTREGKQYGAQHTPSGNVIARVNGERVLQGWSFIGRTHADVIGINGNTVSVAAASLLSDRTQRVARPKRGNRVGTASERCARAVVH
ncbi:hypothetical protein PQR34_03565 [Paraburkholderia sediminicola]|uniref:hypothetical protein n=1 Tax=Paraburkholderia sediminicola TaxID=458836 RepID=UPI0038B8AFEF